MTDLRHDLEELRQEVSAGSVPRAYLAIVGYLSRLGPELGRRHETWTITGLYQGYFDMTYFAIVTPGLKRRGLKIAVVFDYPTFRFQVWLAARNRETQRRFWQLLTDRGWPAGSLVEPAPGVDALIAVDVAEAFALEEPESLTDRLEQAAAELSDRLERFLDMHDPLTA